MTTLPRIKDIASELFVDESIDFHEEHVESSQIDGSTVMSSVVIIYSGDNGELKIQEAVTIDDDYNASTISYHYSVENSEWFYEEGETDKEEVIKEIIREFTDKG